MGGLLKLEGKVALVTGAARGQGASHAKHLAAEGAKVAVLDICHDVPTIYPLATRENLDATVAELRRGGVEAIGIEADVRSSEQMKAAVARVVDELGGIDILCNNAGVCIVEGVDEISDESLDAMIDVNLKGVFNAVRFVAPLMKAQRWGKIINTTSAAAQNALPYISAYCAAKGAVMIATQSWARELAEWEINVNSVSPGTIFSGMTTGLADQLGLEVDDAYAKFMAQQVFKGERGQVQKEDISKMVVYLASEDGRMITGQNYAVDAGWSIT
jgi:NAD(P)-dependent dehydrogenase (short-subunit alcohol dehydrogenase family)